MCTYGLLVSLQNPSSFHKDILIGLGLFFLQNHLKAVEPPKLLLVRSYTGSSSETKMSTQRSSWLPKGVRCSQAGSYTVTSVCMYIYMRYVCETFSNFPSRKSHSVLCSCFCCKAPFTAYTSTTVRYVVHTVKWCLIFYVNRLLPKNGTEMLYIKNSMWLNGIQQFLKAHFHINKCNQIF